MVGGYNTCNTTIGSQAYKRAKDFDKALSANSHIFAGVEQMAAGPLWKL